MEGPARIAAFFVVLVAVFAGAAVAGGAIDPSGSDGDQGSDAINAAAAESGDHGSGQPAGRGSTDAEAGEDSEGSDGASPPGLQVAADGHRLIVATPRIADGGRRAPFEFRIVDGDGETVRDFQVEHDRRMHFIVVRRDLNSFQHLHPKMNLDGAWSTRVDFSSGGVYRVFADFKRDGEKRTLGADVHVPGSYRPRSLPAPGATARTEGGLDVTLRAEGAEAGAETRIGFEVRDRGEVVNDSLQPYLAAKGHLVALRGGDLAYLHTHPDGDELAFESTYPSAGPYRLFVQFRYRGELHTAAFTQEVDQ